MTHSFASANFQEHPKLNANEIAKQSKAVYRALGITKEQIERRKPCQSYIETAFGIQKRMADWHFGGARGKTLRDTAWAAHKAARDADTAPSGDAARAAMCAASAAYLHPLADAHQVKHILGAAAHVARAAELIAGGDSGCRRRAH